MAFWKKKFISFFEEKAIFTKIFPWQGHFLNNFSPVGAIFG